MRVVVGRIGRPHGIRGEVTVEVRTDEPEACFAPDCSLFVNGSERTLVVARSHWHSGRLLISFAGIEDRNQAESLRGLLLEIERADDAVPEDPEEYYDHALVGCTVTSTGGERLGTVREVVHLPGQDLLAVTLTDGREALVPFVLAIVPEVDIAGRRVVIDPPPGLLDEI